MKAYGVPSDAVSCASVPPIKGPAASPLLIVSRCDPPISPSGSALVSGPNAFVIGGEIEGGVVVDTSFRANTAPQSPFFQLGLVGATVPGLQIEGEIGQQLGYLNAAGAGTVNFVILLIFGWAFAHKEQAGALVRRILRR